VPPRLISAQLVIKPAGCRDGIPWHRDCDHPPSGSDHSALTLWLAVSATSRANGCLWYVSGRRAVPQPMNPGEVAVHLPSTLHRSGPNKTSRPRIALMLEYATRGNSPQKSRRCP
jgi:ectoine hydroxylase-related dioxygenase (phytanoyl-CoA dioxygenase family)